MRLSPEKSIRMIVCDSAVNPFQMSSAVLINLLEHLNISIGPRRVIPSLKSRQQEVYAARPAYDSLECFNFQASLHNCGR